MATELMRIYCGVPGEDGAAPTIVVIGDDGEARALRSPDGRSMSWNGKTDPGAVALARAIVLDAIGAVGLEYATRFRWRKVAEWDKKPWSITVDEVRVEIDRIKQVEVETAGERRRAAIAPAPVAFETGQDIVWTRTPAITPNRARTDDAGHTKGTRGKP